MPFYKIKKKKIESAKAVCFIYIYKVYRREWWQWTYTKMPSWCLSKNTAEEYVEHLKRKKWNM